MPFKHYCYWWNVKNQSWTNSSISSLHNLATLHFLHSHKWHLVITVRCRVRHLCLQRPTSRTLLWQTAPRHRLPEGTATGKLKSTSQRWVAFNIYWRLASKCHTILQYLMNSILAVPRERAHQDDSNDTPQTICECQVDFPLMWIKDYPGLS